MLTLLDIQTLMPLVDAGVRATGLQVFNNDGGLRLHIALANLQATADALAKADAAAAKGTETKEGADGHDQA